MEFRICPSWSKKPMTVTDELCTDGLQTEPERFGPGSDIYKSHPDQVIGTVNDTHVVALNIYPVFRPQYLLLNLDSYRSQNDPLDLQDFEASWDLLCSVRSPHYVMYNCTKEAGCSRYHKHMQMVPMPQLTKPGSTEFHFFPDIKDRQVRVPYVYFLRHFDSTSCGHILDAKAIFNDYSDLLRDCREACGIPTAALCPHNVLLVKEWIIVIPRRSGNFKDVSANSAGMMGMPTISCEEQFESWKDLGPAKILSELGFPSRTDP